jgi:hypothetical protein
MREFYSSVKRNEVDLYTSNELISKIKVTWGKKTKVKNSMLWHICSVAPTSLLLI